ncbi:MAG: hypothetical protein V4525_12980 [Pseudomonadota bacterium]
MTNFTRSITISIQDTSGATITVNYGTLTGGYFDPVPIPGTTIQPGTTVSYVNGANDNFTYPGGSILLTPASGGSISVNWNWPSGSLANGSVTTQSVSGLGVSYQMVNTQTNSPTLQVVISNASSFQAIPENN